MNPYDLEGVADTLRVALTMSAIEQRERMRSLRSQVSEFNVYRWAGRMSLDELHYVSASVSRSVSRAALVVDSRERLDDRHSSAEESAGARAVCLIEPVGRV